jgi:hypothetical protein
MIIPHKLTNDISSNVPISPSWLVGVNLYANNGIKKLNNDITTQFSDLKNQDLENIQKQVSLKDFNWHSFETIITQ